MNKDQAQQIVSMALEEEVTAAMAADPNYPLGERDPMRWAVAWRLVRARNNINANGTAAEVDGWMAAWFANCMESGQVSMLPAPA